jgi:RNA polymerase sigma-70 factor (ECF subfamily)
MNANTADEAALIARILEGEKQLFHDLIRPYERSLYLTLLSVLRNSADAEDAAQETALKAYRGLPGFRSESKFSTWIMTIALNEGRNRLERRSRNSEQSLDAETEKFDGDHTPAMLTDWRPVPAEALENKELVAQMEAAIASLPDTYRQVFTLRDLEELDIDEIAKLLDVSVNVVRVRLHRARLKLQKQLIPVLQNAGVSQRRRSFGSKFAGWLGRWS